MSGSRPSEAAGLAREKIDQIFKQWEAQPDTLITDEEIEALNQSLKQLRNNKKDIENFNKNLIATIKKRTTSITNIKDHESNFIALRKQLFKNIYFPDIDKLKNKLNLNITEHNYMLEQAQKFIGVTHKKMATFLSQSDEANFIDDVRSGWLVAVKAAIHHTEDKAGLINYRPIKEDTTALRIAVENKDMEMTAALLATEGIKVNDRSGEMSTSTLNSATTALHCAARKGHRKMIDLLIANGADLYCEDAYGDLPLKSADYSFNKETKNHLAGIYEQRSQKAYDDALEYLNELRDNIDLNEHPEAIENKIEALTKCLICDLFKADKSRRATLRLKLVEVANYRMQTLMAKEPFTPQSLEQERLLWSRLNHIKLLEGKRQANPKHAYKAIKSIRARLYEYSLIDMTLLQVVDIKSAIAWLSTGKCSIDLTSTIIRKYLLHADPDKVNLAINDATIEDIRQLKTAIMECIKSITAYSKNSLPNTHWIYTLPPTNSLPNPPPVLYQILKTSDHKKSNHETGSWKTFVNLIKTGNYKKEEPVKLTDAPHKFAAASKDAKNAQMETGMTLPGLRKTKEDDAL
jgi:hypothetical protein